MKSAATFAGPASRAVVVSDRHDSDSALPHFQAAQGHERFLSSLVESTIIHPEDWETLPDEMRDRLAGAQGRTELLRRLAELHLLNAYQVGRLDAGASHGLVLGHYRVLGSAGAGSAGGVFLAEHLLMRRKVAIKVLAVEGDEALVSVNRFLREIRCVARLNHPNIVSAFDAGIARSTRSPARAGQAFQPDSRNEDEPVLYYFVMEYLAGADLEKHVATRPLSIAEACALIHQAANGLDEAHRHQLVHRDIKPSNIFITEDGVAKLLDFGLVRQTRLEGQTAPGLDMGTLNFMAPEQACSSPLVDIRTDIFSLGATLFFALTGRGPFSDGGSYAEMARRRQTEKPLSVGLVRSDTPKALEAVLNRMMALAPQDRYAAPQAVMHALLPFIELNSDCAVETAHEPSVTVNTSVHVSTAAKSPCVLIVEPDASVRDWLSNILKSTGVKCLEAVSAPNVRARLKSEPVDAVLLATELPDGNGADVLRELRDNPPCASLKILMTAKRASSDEMALLLSSGADDYIDLPMSNIQLCARVNSAIKHKQAQERVDLLGRQLLELNVELERSLDARTTDLLQARNSLVLALARLVEYRSTETIAHLSRMQRYATTLAQQAATQTCFSAQIDEEFIQTLECCAPLHDIGNVGLPDAVLLKVGRLDPEERKLMQRHTIIGAETLQQVAHRVGTGASFLRMAIDIARHHHEHWDGTGYPDGLRGDHISLSARIVAIADAYDGLRSRRAQRPGLPHALAIQVILESSPGKFDPQLLRAFQHRAAQFERIFRDLPDSITID